MTAITAIFRDSDELRVNRAKARMKFLFINHGWTAESFLAEVERRIGYSLEPRRGRRRRPRGSYRDHVGVHPQKQPGLHYAGFSVVSGRITPRAAASHRHARRPIRRRIAASHRDAERPRYEHSRIERTPRSSRQPATLGVPLGGSPVPARNALVHGSEYCKLAITETKLFSIRLAQELEDRLPGFTRDR